MPKTHILFLEHTRLPFWKWKVYQETDITIFLQSSTSILNMQRNVS